jgi:hypothetical protein
MYLTRGTDLSTGLWISVSSNSDSPVFALLSVVPNRVSVDPTECCTFHHFQCREHVCICESNTGFCYRHLMLNHKYFSSPGCQSEAAQHCIAALAYGCLEMHRQETMSWEFDYRQEQMKHNGLAISLLKRDIASSKFAAESPATVNTIFLLSFLAVRSSITIQICCVQTLTSDEAISGR